MQSHPQPRNQDQLSVSELESRMMLSTVSLNVAGQTGEENFQVLVNDSVVLDATAPTGGTDFSIEVADSIRPEDIKIEFTNDVFDSAQGVDRNLVVQYFALNAERFDFEDSGMFSSGAWRPEDGVVAGFGRGNVLHANGYFQFTGGGSSSGISFDNKQWTASQPTDQISVDGDELVIGGNDGAVSLSTEVDFEPGVLSELTVEAWRDPVTGSFRSANQPWASAGINFYDDAGNKIDEYQLEFNSEATDPATSKSRSFTTPANATSAFVWAWVDGQSASEDIPLRVRDIRLEATDLSQDTTAPQISQDGQTVLLSPASEVNFNVQVVDDFRLASDNAGLAPGAILVTGPNGYSQIAEPRTGFGDFVTSGTIVYGIVKDDGSDFQAADNGIYEFFLQEDKLADAAGNVTPAQRIGSFELAITDPAPDNEPPTIRLQSVTGLPQVVGESNPIEIVIFTNDNLRPLPFASRLTLVRPDGSTEELRGIAGGIDQATGEAWELFQVLPGAGGFSSADNGEYSIRLEANALVDQAGNAAPEQVVGSFLIAIPDHSSLA